MTCCVDDFTKWTHKIVAGKSWCRVMKLWKIDTKQTIWRMNWNTTTMISYICFLFLLFGVSVYHLNKNLHCFPQIYDDSFSLFHLLGAKGGRVHPSRERNAIVTSELVYRHFHNILRLFWCIAKFYFLHKWNNARSSLINMVCTSCLTSCQTNWILGNQEIWGKCLNFTEW